MQVTVAIPVYNSASTLERAIRSAMQQTLSDLEIIIADDGSADDSAAIAERMAAEDARIHVIRFDKNGGKPRAMNAIIAQARGDWVAVLDADDTYEPQRLAKLVEHGIASGAEIVVDNLRYIDAGINKALRTAFPPTDDIRILATADMLQNADSMSEFDFGILKPMIRREFFQRHNLTYKENALFAEDFYYLLDFFVAGGRACLVGQAYYNWTLPFGTISRAWTKTGHGAWRYDYAKALVVNQIVIEEMKTRGEHQVVALLQRRDRQYRIMIPYMLAQRQASEGHRITAALTILRHPETFGMLFARIYGRVLRSLRSPPPLQLDGMTT
jgi:succinoglycan biosynthesis protein ExoO